MMILEWWNVTLIISTPHLFHCNCFHTPWVHSLLSAPTPSVLTEWVVATWVYPYVKVHQARGWPRGQVVKFVRSAAGGPVFRWFESWARAWHCSSNHAEAASHVPQLEGPTTKNIQLCTGGLWGEKGKNFKIFKKKKTTKWCPYSSWLTYCCNGC